MYVYGPQVGDMMLVREMGLEGWMGWKGQDEGRANVYLLVELAEENRIKRWPASVVWRLPEP